QQQQQQQHGLSSMNGASQQLTPQQQQQLLSIQHHHQMLHTGFPQPVMTFGGNDGSGQNQSSNAHDKQPHVSMSPPITSWDHMNSAMGKMNNAMTNYGIPQYGNWYHHPGHEPELLT